MPFEPLVMKAPIQNSATGHVQPTSHVAPHIRPSTSSIFMHAAGGHLMGDMYLSVRLGCLGSAIPGRLALLSHGGVLDPHGRLVGLCLLLPPESKAGGGRLGVQLHEQSRGSGLLRFMPQIPSTIGGI